MVRFGSLFHSLRLMLAVGAIMALMSPAAVQAQVGGTISEIRIDGTQRIEPETVKSYLLIQPGDAFDGGRIDQSLKALFATGLFADVNLRREGNALVVRVVENPIINRIAFEGNRKLTDTALTAEVQLRARVVYTRTRVQADVKRILDLYRRSGRFAATVDPKVIPLEQNRVDLVFEIDEGATTGIKSINFVGNKQFSPSRLRGVVQTKESRWYRFFSSDDTYDPDRLTYDRDLLRKFYLSEGYADFRVVAAVAELTPARDGFFVTYTIEEGERYNFGKIDISNQIKEINVDDLKPVITVKEGNRYNADEVEKTINALTDALGTRGFAFVDIQPRVRRNGDSRTVDITFEIQEGPRVYVERIDIVGNVRTLDKVIRREFQLAEGDAFNTSKMRRSEQRVKNLGFFKKTEITNAPGSAPDKTVVTAKVEEQSTGEFSVGVGFSSTDGVLADVSVRERNLLGKGQDLRVSALVAQRTQEIDLSFTEPHFLDRNLSAGWDLFEVTRTNATTNQQFDQFSLGGSLRLGYQISERLRQTLRYTLRQDSIQNVEPTASAFIRQQQGSRIASLVGQELLYDRRDDRLDPTDGYYAQFNSDIAGLGGDARYLKTVLTGGYFYSIAPQWVLSLTGETGNILGLGQKVKIQDRFFIGGDNLRGFATGGIGPRDPTTHDALGGNFYYVSSIGLGFPLGLPKELGITGRLFTDVGSLFEIDENPFSVQDIKALRMSSGIGASWASPLGPIRLDVAYPIKARPLDKKQFFRVSFGTRF